MKRLVAVGLAAVLLCGGASAADWPSWADEAQAWAVEQGISDSFLSAPSMELTRGQTVQLLYEAAGRPAVSEEMPFTDVNGAYENAVIWAAGQGYVQGTGDGKFRPVGIGDTAGICRNAVSAGRRTRSVRSRAALFFRLVGNCVVGAESCALVRPAGAVARNGE